MAPPKLTRLELQIMEALWSNGVSSVRDSEAFPPKNRPAYTTVQTTVYRLEAKKALHRQEDRQRSFVRRADLPRSRATPVDRRFSSMFGDHIQPVMAHFIESGKFTKKDVQEAPRTLRKLAKRSETP